MERIRFIVAEKSYLIRKGIVSIINRVEGASVIHEMDNLDQINSVILNLNPDFLVLNPNLLPENEGFRNFKIKLDPAEKLIALTSSSPMRRNLIRNFREIIDVNESKDSIFSKIEKLAEPQSWGNKSTQNSSELSDREKTILAEVARGLTNKEIADKLFLSVHTVITHRKNITNKLGIKTISGLTVYAILNKLIGLEDL